MPRSIDFSLEICAVRLNWEIRLRFKPSTTLLQQRHRRRYTNVMNKPFCYFDIVRFHQSTSCISNCIQIMHYARILCPDKWLLKFIVYSSILRLEQLYVLKFKFDCDKSTAWFTTQHISQIEQTTRLLVSIHFGLKLTPNCHQGYCNYSSSFKWSTTLPENICIIRFGVYLLILAFGHSISIRGDNNAHIEMRLKKKWTT